MVYWQDIADPLDGSPDDGGGGGDEEEGGGSSGRIRSGVPVAFGGGAYLLTDPWQHPWQYEVFRPEESDEYQQNTRNMTYDLWSFGDNNSAGKDPELEGKWINNW